MLCNSCWYPTFKFANWLVTHIDAPFLIQRSTKWNLCTSIRQLYMDCNAPRVVHTITRCHHKFMVVIEVVTNWIWVVKIYSQSREFCYPCCGVCFWFKSGNDWITSNANCSNKFLLGQLILLNLIYTLT